MGGSKPVEDHSQEKVDARMKRMRQFLNPLQQILPNKIKIQFQERINK
jgi:hypothetical protein